MKFVGVIFYIFTSTTIVLGAEKYRVGNFVKNVALRGFLTILKS